MQYLKVAPIDAICKRRAAVIATAPKSHPAYMPDSFPQKQKAVVPDCVQSDRAFASCARESNLQ